MLSFDKHVPRDADDGATVLVLLHGRGSHGGDLQALAPWLPKGWGLLTPQAPHLASPWGYGPGWAWYRYVDGDRLVSDTLDRSLSELDTFLDEIPDLIRLRPGRLVLGGFSQGGTTSLAYALTRPGRATAVLNFSGFLADTELIDPGDLSPDATSVFWAHGTRDGNIPFALAADGRARLTRAGVPLTVRDYEIGHWMVQSEVTDAVTFLEELPTIERAVRRG